MYKIGNLWFLTVASNIRHLSSLYRLSEVFDTFSQGELGWKIFALMHFYGKDIFRVTTLFEILPSILWLELVYFQAKVQRTVGTKCPFILFCFVKKVLKGFWTFKSQSMIYNYETLGIIDRHYIRNFVLTFTLEFNSRDFWL